MNPTEKITVVLAQLHSFERDVVTRYDELIRRAGLPGVTDQLAQFRNEHRKHLSDLSDRLHALGADTDAAPGPENAAFDRLRDDSDPYGALDGARQLEEGCLAEWKSALSNLVRDDEKDLFRRYVEDEERHLRMIEQMLTARTWAVTEIEPTIP